MYSWVNRSQSSTSPKREAEENLPTLSDKDGIQIVIRDVYSNQEWSVKYKYWSNNKSRMYVLENTVDFVRQNELVIGDSITLYEDECKSLYVTIKRGERPVVEDLEDDDQQQQQPAYRKDMMMMSNRNHMMMSYNVCHNQYYTPFTYGNRDHEEEAYLALLIEQLRHKEELEANSLATLSIGSGHAASSSHRHPLI
ncbi:B3 domain-containing transcription factor LEC2 [Juglans microcarpa x Juglans regia]|uniref:B3 domain-containing transcription factor LEC2 n=1 Tax=Juglans microcarpa x Juglans regia TaxID=2249226 RepID=UPI001B7EBF3B|nr:B3 domain-containing transcription factor LEC2 [Juglans microcarpa x Juglans regia]